MTTMTTTYKTVRAERRALTPGARPMARISTDELDSQNDRIVQDGLSFRDNMRVLFAHDAHGLPVARVAAIHRDAGHTDAEFEWFQRDADIDKIRNIYDQGGLDASVGMLVHAAEPNDDGGFNILKATVIEFSLTAVPANASAVALMKSLATRGSFAPRSDDIVLVLRDDDAPGHVGHNRCPGPYGAGGCPLKPTVAVEGCPAAADRRCPMLGQNLESALVLVDPPAIDYSKRSLEETIVAVLRDVVAEEVTAQARRAVTRLTGRID